MKNRLFSYCIVIALLFSALYGCTASVKDSSYSDIFCTSSSSVTYAEYLTKRLTSLPHDITLCIGDNDEFGIDMSTFEEDGYIIRIEGDDALIAGKSAEGLDLACRFYANAVESGSEVKSTVYHEGYRIDRLYLFGLPIDRYSVVCDDSISLAEAEFIRLTKAACGVTLSSVPQDDPSSPRIIINLTDDASLGGGFRIFEMGGDLILEGASDAACLWAVYSFFEEFCGWECLRYGDSELHDSSYVSVPTGISYTETPAFDYFSDSLSDSFVTDRASASLSEDTVTHADGSDSGIFDLSLSPLCLSAEETYNNILSAVKAHLSENPTATQIDLSPLYRDGCCPCADCSAIALEENSSSIGTAVRLANRLSDELSGSYPGIVFKLLVSVTETAVPVTRPGESVYITLDYNGVCVAHKLFGSDCSDSSDKGSVQHDRLSGWADLTDNLYVRLVYGRSPFFQYSVIGVMRENIRYLRSVGVRGVFFDTTDDPFGFQRIECQLFSALCRDPDMSAEEYEDLLCKLLKKEFGDGYMSIRRYIDLLDDSRCFGECFTDTSQLSDIACDFSLYADSFDEYTDLFDTAARFACNRTQEYRVEALSCHMYYLGCFSSYFPAYYTDNADALEDIADKYAVMLTRIAEAGFDYEGHLSDNLFVTAWTVWDKLTTEIPENPIVSPPSDKYIETIASACENIAPDRLTIVFKTDSHYSADSSSRLSSLNEMRQFGGVQHHMPIDLYVHGGDLINGNHKTEEIAKNSILEPVSAMTESSRVPFFQLRGNHDDNGWAFASTGIFPSDGVIDTEEWRKYALSQTEGIVMGDGAYGYFDHEESKIRVLFLDTSDLPYEEDENGAFRYSSYRGHGLRNDQLNFIAEALAFSDKGEDGRNWAVLIMSHVPTETLRTPTSTYRFGIPDAQPRNNYAFLRLLKAYQRGEVFNETIKSPTNYGDGGYNTGSKNDATGDFAYSVYADYTKNGPGEVIGFICGHLHTDNFADNVGHASYSTSTGTIYPGLSDGYPYISISNGGFAVITVDRNYDGTGTVYVDRCGTSTVPYADMIAEGDRAVHSSDPSIVGVTTSPTATGSVASGKYSIVYTQNP